MHVLEKIQVYPFNNHIHLVWISVYVILLINKKQKIYKCPFEYKVFYTNKNLKGEGHSNIF